MFQWTPLLQHDAESMDAKMRYVLQRLKSGSIVCIRRACENLRLQGVLNQDVLAKHGALLRSITDYTSVSALVGIRGGYKTSHYYHEDLSINHINHSMVTRLQSDLLGGAEVAGAEVAEESQLD